MVFANFFKTTLFCGFGFAVAIIFGAGMLTIVFLYSGLLVIFVFFGVLLLIFTFFLSLGVTGDFTLGNAVNGLGEATLGDLTLSGTARGEIMVLGRGETDFLCCFGEARALNFLIVGTYPLGVAIRFS